MNKHTTVSMNKHTTRTNKDRAADILPMVVAASVTSGNTEERLGTQIGDIIADLLHLAAENGIRPQSVLDNAVSDF